MGISISDLPVKYQRQAWKAIQEHQALERQKRQGAGRGSKYRNQADCRGDIRFDSKKEARRYDALALMLRAGDIWDLRLQADFTLQEAYTTPEGERIRAIRYKADFVYMRKSPLTGEAEMVIEDVKSRGTVTDVYTMKKKMMEERMGLSITEV